MDISTLRNAVESRRIEWQRHCLERILERNISRSAVFKVIRGGEIIEQYPEDRPFPSALILGWIEKKPVHVVAAFDSTDDMLHIITVYEPSLEYFEPDFKTRRKK